MLKESILLKILKVGVYAVALVPLIIFSQFLSPFHFGKVIVFRSIVELMLVFYVMLVLLNRAYLPKFNKLAWGFLAFTLAFTLATIASSQVAQSFWGTLERMGGLWTFWHYFAFFIILISTFRIKEEWLSLFKFMAIVGVLSALYGFGQKTNSSFFVGGQGRARIFGTIGNAALFAGYQLFIVFMSLALFFRKAVSDKERWIYGLAAVICAIAVMMTAVRGSILALGVGVLVYASLYLWITRSRLAKRALVGLVTLFVAFIILAGVLRGTGAINSGYFERITNFSPTNFTVQTRIWAWTAGFEGWKESLKTMLVGWGPENFNIPFSKHFNPKFYTGPGSETLFDRAHNMFVEVLVTMGLIGFATYLFMFFATLKSLWDVIKRRDEYLHIAIGLVALIVVYIIHNAFIFDTSANFITFFFLLGFVYFVSGADESGSRQATKGDGSGRPLVKKWLVGPIGTVLFIVMLFVIFKTNIPSVSANYATTRAMIIASDTNFKNTVEQYKKAMSYNVSIEYEIRNKFVQYVLEFTTANPSDQLVIDALKLAISEEEKNADNFPIDYLPKLYLSRLHVMLGRGDLESPYNDEALRYSLEALELAPKFVRTYYEVAQGYLNKKDNANAMKYLEEAVKLNPEVGISYWYLGMLKYDMGLRDEGARLVWEGIARGFSPGELDYVKLSQIYLRESNYASLAYAYEGIIKINETKEKRDLISEANYHATLAAVYQKMGNIDEAVAQAHLAAQYNPELLSAAQSFVRGMGRQW